MEINYFPDTDTLLITFADKEIAETRDVNENTLMELDKDGDLVSLTIEHAKRQMDIESFSYRKVANEAAEAPA